ncbi:MAG TPA: response regulator [bacterium]|nr:response regulator [bacterium]
MSEEKVAQNDKTRKRRILVVEPDREFLGLLRDFFTGQKFEVEKAETGDEGIKKAREFAPDVVLLSRELPMPGGNHGPDGLRVLKVIKQDRKLGKIPVILFSAEAAEADFDRYRKLKFTANDYIRKPFEDTEILRRVENLVGFDLTDDVKRIKARIEDAMEEDPIISIFDADPEELGLGSRAARNEVARLLEQVGQELELNDQEAAPDEQQDLPLTEEKTAEAAPELNGELARLRAENQAQGRRLDRLQKLLVTERKRSRDIKKEWKARLQEIAARLAEKEETESKMRDEFDAMRMKFADLELDHTMELDRVSAEKRRLEEDLEMVKEMLEMSSAYPRQEILDDMKKLLRAVSKIIKGLEADKKS